MKPAQRPLVPVWLSLVAVVAAMLLGWASAPVGAAPVGSIVVAEVNGAVRGPPEGVAFSGQASISGKVIDDGVFGAPPVLEIFIDLSQVSGVGLSSGKKYLVSTQTRLQRPVLAFDSIEVTFPFFADGDMLSARSAQAYFSIYFSATKGIRTSKVVVTANQPG